MKKKIKKTTAKSRSKESDYIDSLDLRTWWDSFSSEVNDNGTMKFKTVWAFIQKQTKIQWQRELLYWILGPTVDNNPASPYKSFQQFDWEDKRNKGVWYASKNIETLNKSLASKEHSLAKLAELGGINVKIIGRLETIMHQIDKEFSAGIFLPSLSAKENGMRAQLYMDLNNQVINQLKLAQEMYGRTQGVELNALNQLIAMFSSGSMPSSGMGAALGFLPSSEESQGKDGMKSVSTQLIDMMTKKALNYNMDLPDKEMTEIVIKAQPKLVKNG